jgi:hypothetical protein
VPARADPIIDCLPPLFLYSLPLIPSYPISFHLIPSHPTSSHLIPPHPTSSYLIPPHPLSPHPITPFLIPEIATGCLHHKFRKLSILLRRKGVEPLMPIMNLMLAGSKVGFSYATQNLSQYASMLLRREHVVTYREFPTTAKNSSRCAL